MDKTPYMRELSRKYPGLFVILLDQSLSMAEVVDGGHKDVTKAMVVANQVNTIIQELIDNAGVEETLPGLRKKYAYLSVLGYHDEVKPLLARTETPIDIPTLARNPAGMIPEIHEVRDTQGKVLKTFTRNKYFWIQPDARSNTNMNLAFEHAINVVDSWLKQPPELISPDLGMQSPRNECFPPVVINVTDGYYNTGGPPRRAVEALSRLHTDTGNTLIFNCHFTTEKKTPCLFPRHESEVKGIDPYGRAEEMFYMSSIIPEPLRLRASRTMRRPIEEGARCVVYNASLDILIQFLRWGTVGINPATGPGEA